MIGAGARGRARRRAGAEHCPRQASRDERAGPDPPVDVALGVKLLEGGHHGVARHGELARQHARRRQPGARAQRAVQDRAANREIDLAVQRLGAAPVDHERRRQGAADGALDHGYSS
jgi:hypothetical protein